MKRIKALGRKTFSSLQIRNFRLYFIGQVISTSGTFMQWVAQAWLVLKLTNSGTALGVVTALQYAPILFLGALGGVVADRFSKRKILYITQSIAGLLAIILGVLVTTGTVKLWMVYVLALALGIVNSIDNPSRQTFIIEMVGPEELKNAVTLNSTQVNLSRIVGPAIGGILLSTLGLAPLFILNGLSYAAVVIMLYLMNPGEITVTHKRDSKLHLLEGFRYVALKPILRNALIMMAIIGTLTYEFQVSLPLLAQFAFHGNAQTYAALLSALGAGSVLGGLLTASRGNIKINTMVVSAFLFGVSVIIASFMPSVALAIVAMVLVGFFSITFTTVGNAILQLNSSPEMRGRVMALWSIAFLGSTTVGGPIVGWVGEAIGPRWGLGIGGIAAVAASLVGLIFVY